MCQELQHYYNYPTYTTVEVETHSQIEFPAVTFCNLNSLNKSNIVNDSRIDNYYLSIGPRMLIGFNKSINWSDPFYTEQGFFKKRTEPDILAENKLLYYGLLNIFLFDQKTINSGYEEYFTIKLALNGPCLTSNLTTIFKSSYTGSEYNLVLWLNVDRKNSYFGQWMGEGIQRPVWVDELFTNIRHIETRLDKLDQIGILVNSMNMKVIKVEQETKSLSERLAAVEISTQYVSDQYEDQKTKCNELKSKLSST
ncbi:ASIC5 [Mytilus coruscus]|uniref:ASIC5 n=1 Tax=Mytilus coruscus TaxID=42192 RepID=A0A6J8A5X5_MYTCO|nr:ASIC5 [Mytilus coruscus]